MQEVFRAAAMVATILPRIQLGEPDPTDIDFAFTMVAMKVRTGNFGLFPCHIARAAQVCWRG